MRRTAFALIAAVIAVAACGAHALLVGDDAGVDAGGGGDAKSSPNSDAGIVGFGDVKADVVATAGDGGPDAAFPMAKGDPCRGFALPLDKHFVAAGLCARLVAKDERALRQITFAPNGDLWVASLDGYVKVMRDANANGVYETEEIHTWAPTLSIGNNVHLDVAGGFVYAGSPAGVVRWPYDPNALTATTDAEPVMVAEPSDGHPLHTVHVYDGYLYVMSGSAGDATNAMDPEYDTTRSLLRRWLLSSFTVGTPWQWTSGENVSLGLRNMVGFTRNTAGRMYGVVNGMDGVRNSGVDLQTDNPGEQVVNLAMGTRYGYPFCFTAQRAVIDGGLIPPGTQLAYDSFTHDNAWCAANSMKPATFLQAHSAPLDILFFDNQPQGALSERWRGGAFVTLHGSHLAESTGFKVVWVPFDASGASPLPTSTTTTSSFPYEVIFGGGDTGGPIDGAWTWTAPVDGGGTAFESPRPVGLAIHPIDGALYISSDTGGVIYRVGLAN